MKASLSNWPSLNNCSINAAVSYTHLEEFESFMKSRMPHMTKGEIVAFGQAMILNKSFKMEKSLNGLLGLLKEEPKK